MIVQENKNGALFIYIPKSIAEDADIKKGDKLRACLLDGIIRIQKRKTIRGNVNG